ncbi:hypothetical protein [Corynebacterium matruchotii]|uniref:hypothetical protein n=1 Tax=Corynebacterium matruchotii TaxID=43768 RepID=UPI00243099C5|nr:hypothetical protein [Corynebacterium matruchotii]
MTGWRLAGIAPGSTSDSCETRFGGGGKHGIVGIPQLPNLLPGAVRAVLGRGWVETVWTGVDKQAITLYDARQHHGSTSDSCETGSGGA